VTKLFNKIYSSVSPRAISEYMTGRYTQFINAHNGLQKLKLKCKKNSNQGAGSTGALAINKPKTTAMVIIARWLQVSHTAFSYSMYSRWHVIGYCRWPASLLLVMLITTWAVHHLAIAPLGMIAGDNFQAVDLQARYRDLYLFYVYGWRPAGNTGHWVVFKKYLQN